MHNSSIKYFASYTTLKTRPCSTTKLPKEREREQTYSANPLCTKGISLTQPNWMPNSRTSNVVLQESIALFIKACYLHMSISETEVQSGILDTKAILQRVE